MTTFTDSTARDAVMAWKHRQVVRYATALLVAGFRVLRRDGATYFGTDDVGEADQPAGDDAASIPGSAVVMLRRGGCIADYYGTHPDAGVSHGRRRSKRESRNGAKVGLYSLIVPMAREWLLRNGVRVAEEQRELALAV